MVNFDEWAGLSNSSGGENRYAIRQWRIIQRNPNSLVLVRGETSLATQTVSVQHSNEEQGIAGASGALGSRREIIVFGVKGHPSVADTDIQRDDQFEYLDRLYRVTDVIVNLGSVQAWGMAIS